MDAHPRCGLSYHVVDYYGAEGRLDFPRREGPQGDVLARLFKRIFLITLSVMCRRECFDEAGYFDENLRFAQDYELWLRMAARFRFGCIDRVLGRYRFHPGNLSWESEARRLLEKLRSRRRIYADPAAAGRIPRKLYRREIASTTFKLARLYLREGDKRKSREMIGESVRNRPLDWRRWILWLRARL